MIKVRGWQVSPAELESVLMIHTEILEAAVIGTSNPNVNGDTEVPRAYIVKVPESDLSESDVKTHMAAYLAKYKNLDGGIVFTDRIPRTSTGKIDRKSLRERAKLESKDAHIKTLVLTAFSTLRRIRQPSYEEPKTATASSYGSDGVLPVSPITTTSDYSDPDGERQEAARASRYYHYGMYNNTSHQEHALMSLSFSEEIAALVEGTETGTIVHAKTKHGLLDNAGQEFENVLNAPKSHDVYFLGWEVNMMLSLMR